MLNQLNFSIWSKYCIGLLCALLLSINTLAQIRVVGYIPAYKGLKASIDSSQITDLTHLNIAFINPDKDGNLLVNNEIICMLTDSDANVAVDDLHYAVNKAHLSGVKVLVSMAGALITPCSGDWAALLQDKTRNKLINNISAFIDKFNLDGIDIDIEGKLLTEIDIAGNFTPFIAQLSKKLHKQGKLLTCATASYEGGMIPVESVEYFDFVNIMSYDAIGPGWGAAGSEHATYEQAVSHLEIWRKKGLSRDKMVLGVPFYGYGFGDYSGTYSFDDILHKFGKEAANKDFTGELCAGCNYVTYNGLATIRAKTRLALEKGSGIMIWELTHDTKGKNSLLRAVNSEISKIEIETALKLIKSN